MSTKLEIANLALHHIGQKQITELTAGSSVQADAVNVIYTPDLEEVLWANNWKFARSIVALVVVSASYEPLNWTYGYTYPSNCVIVRKVYNEASTDKKIGEKFEEIYDPSETDKVILTDVDDAYAEFTYNLTDTTLFDSSFVVAFSHRLASDLAINLNGDKEMARGEIIVYNGLISEAKRMSKLEVHNPRTQVSSYEEAR